MKAFLLSLVAGSVACSTATAQAGGSADSVQAHLQKAHVLLQQNKPALAVPEFAAVVAIDPKNLDAQANLGVLLYFEHQYGEAEPHLRVAMEIQPDLAKIQALLGMCDHQIGKDALARMELETALPRLQEAGVRTESGLQLIEIYTATQDLAKAPGVVELMRQTAPTDPRILYAAYRIYTDLAGDAMLDLSLSAPSSGQMHQAMAHELQRERDEKGAVANYRQAIAADPSLPGIHYDFGEVLHASSDPTLHAEAEQQYQLAVKANSHDVKAMTRLGDIAADKGEVKQAEVLYHQALNEHPGDPDADIGLAKVLVDQNDLAGALPLLQEVIAADPTNLTAHYRLSALYRRMKRPDDAKREIDTYEKYKAIKDKLRKVYDELRMDNPQTTAAEN